MTKERKSRRQTTDSQFSAANAAKDYVQENGDPKGYKYLADDFISVGIMQERRMMKPETISSAKRGDPVFHLKGRRVSTRDQKQQWACLGGSLVTAKELSRTSIGTLNRCGA
jgi:hypothetical protein